MHLARASWGTASARLSIGGGELHNTIAMPPASHIEEVLKMVDPLLVGVEREAKRNPTLTCNLWMLVQSTLVLNDTRLVPNPTIGGPLF